MSSSQLSYSTNDDDSISSVPQVAGSRRRKSSRCRHRSRHNRRSGGRHRSRHNRRSGGRTRRRKRH